MEADIRNADLFIIPTGIDPEMIGYRSVIDAVKRFDFSDNLIAVYK